MSQPESSQLTNDFHVRLWKEASRREHVHMVGIGGTGMRALAEFLDDCGCSISGSDLSSFQESERSQHWSVRIGHSGQELPQTTDLVIHSPAVPLENPALVSARDHGLTTMNYADVLAALSRNAETYCVAGTHGKSTTAAMLAHLLETPGDACGAIIGAESIDREASGWSGDHQRLVLESCEYRQHFLQFDANHAIVTNIEGDHFDCYPELQNTIDAFAQFVARVPTNGKIVIPSHQESVWQIVRQAPGHFVTFGVECPAEWRAEEVQVSQAGTSFQLCHLAKRLGRIELSIHGRHNISNALAAMTLACELGVPVSRVMERASTFSGVKRRMELLAQNDHSTLIDDYAHHPTAVRCLLETIRSRYPQQRIRCLFQPHQLSRTERLFDDFVQSLLLADEVWIAPVFTARENQNLDAGACSLRLAAACQSAGVAASAVGSLDQLTQTVEDTASAGDVVITVGAGDINRIHHELIGRLFRHSDSGRTAG